eukprot:TRINITY_DN964_c0_g1_i1.p1 TRINITY_DN964_c0_g1~~TRINITY_DN964_c0_g1_i1.p1  ORF type:complete len:361 (+),score=39.57 TRINITY_DN964_c0_g1_i1:74-1156(+)
MASSSAMSKSSASLPLQPTATVSPGTLVEDRISTLLMCKLVLPPIVLLGSGAAVLHILEGWPASISMYVVAQMVTTVGWGDVVVDSPPAKIFMSFYAFAILAVVAYYDNLCTVYWMNCPSKNVGTHLRRDYFSDISDSTPCSSISLAVKPICSVVVALMPVLVFIGIGSIYFFFRESCVCKRSIHFENNSATCIDTQGYDKCVETGGITQTLVDIVYMSVITLSTIGYGDFHPYPSDGIGLLFVILWTLLGVCATAVSITNLSEAFFGMELAKRLEASDVACCHDDVALRRIDKSSSGHLSRGEYISWMVIKHDLVSQALIDEIYNSYDGLDTEKTNSVPYRTVRRASESLMGFVTDEDP